MTKAKKTTNKPKSKTSAKAKPKTKATPKTTTVAAKKSKTSELARALKEVQTEKTTPTSKPSIKSNQTVSINKSLLIVIAGIVLGLLLAGVFFAQRILTAATVNGERISRLSIIRDLESQYGAPALDNMITETLIAQELEKNNIVISPEEIDTKMAELESQIQAQGQSLDTLLAMQGETREQLRENYRLQLGIEELLGEPEEASAEAVAAFIEENADYLPEDATQEELEELATEQINQDNRQTLFNTWISDLQTNASINRNVAY